MRPIGGLSTTCISGLAPLRTPTSVGLTVTSTGNVVALPSGGANAAASCAILFRMSGNTGSGRKAISILLNAESSNII